MPYAADVEDRVALDGIVLGAVGDIDAATQPHEFPTALPSPVARPNCWLAAAAKLTRPSTGVPMRT